MSLFQNRTLTFKMSFLFYCLLISFAVVMFLFVKSDVGEAVKRASLEKAKSDLQTSMSWMDSRHPGEWKAKDGVLYKGELALNGQTELVDQIGTMTGGDTVTFFLQDTRVATNVVENGKRVLNSKISEEIGKKVLGAGEPFYGEANVVGHMYQAAYAPLKDSQGKSVGIFYVGSPTHIVDDAVQSTVKSCIIVLLIFLFLSLAVLIPFMRRIGHRLNRVTFALAEAGRGSFSARINDRSRDEIGRLADGYNRMKEQIQALIESAQSVSETVAASSEQLTASSEQSSRATEMIAGSINEVAAGTERQIEHSSDIQHKMNAISGNVDRIQEQIASAREAAGDSSAATDEGTEKVRQTIQQMNRIREKSAASAQLADLVSAKTKEITQVVGLISEIAERTNLLALNASIEAARAGQAGGGFTVVAAEVRKLSTQTQESIATVGGFIRDVQSSTTQLVQSIQDNEAAVAAGMDITEATGRSFEDILRHAGVIADRLEQIGGTSNDIRTQADFVLADLTATGKVVEDVAALSQNVAAAAEEQSASMEEITSSATALSAMAEELHRTISAFSFKQS